MNTAEAPHRDLRPALVFLSGELIAVPIPLEREEVTLGRSLGADVRVNDSKASRKHAKIEVRGTPDFASAEYVVTDLNSRNGTFLNGAPYQVRGSSARRQDLDRRTYPEI